MKARSERLTAGDTPGTEADISLISQAMSRMRLMIGRRIIGRLAMKRASLTLELSHLDVIEAVRRISEGGEVTVGAVADMMRVDPSRSSRLIAELVQGGFLVRSVSQADARRAVVEVTDKARAYFREAQGVKRDLIESIVADWSPEDIAHFGRLYLKFVEEFEQRAKASDV
ncbi:DNA-binding transcriptional regulator, MarR family [Ensifer adhaerens]|nr:DNA-binding transcriptional regulator, MarR family [Ensifer adhaerens]